MIHPPKPPAFDGSDPQKPLENWVSGKFVLVTRPERQSGSLCELFEAKGAKTRRHPVIEISPAENQRDLIEAVSQIGDFEWLVLVSRNAVRFAMEAVEEVFGELDQAPFGKVAAIGQSTADLFYSITGRKVDLVPVTANSETLGTELGEIAGVEKVMVFRGNRGSAVLGQYLSDAKLNFREVVVYQSQDVAVPQPEVQSLLQAGKVDWVTVTSSAIAKATVALFGEDLKRTKLVSISPGVTQVLTDSGFEVAAEASSPGMKELVAAVNACECDTC
ncbi:uroporphyrinogen-III synthase [Mariniblastus sp.]|nr:uroporphyrinogen-III synthase [Mariniblastus sp.]MDA7905849.1 uroporphyrinogen-III synthase [Mariniblastus sp.]MDB4381057.1 uroporphyrinogen-III synthase [Mariniblastus sp.]MDB4460367.1 uroporphyrinogen-III synthase [bacterium]MDC3224285.1 uroporphyrinogen-III synthase [Mariniblastus sp.]